jgi:signal transduction histidine kinase
MAAWRFLRSHLDLGIAVALAIGLAIEVLLWPGVRPALAVLTSLLATLPQIWRRSHPVAAFLGSFAGALAIAAAAPGWNADAVTFLVLYFLALFSLGAYSRGIEVPISCGLVLVGIVLFMITDGEFQPIDAVFATGFVGGPWAAGLAIRLRRDHESRLTAANEALHADQEKLARRAVAEERARIARELHDVVSHAISVTVLQARGASRTLGHDDEAVRRSLEAIEQTNTAALGDMRRLLTVLRDVEGDGSTSPQPSLTRLDALLEEVRRSGLAVELEETGPVRDVPPGVDLSAYRIVQEALTNVIKHAGPATARVRVEYGADALRVAVRDDGRGERADDSTNQLGHGLIGITERVAVVGGQVTAGPCASGGFEVSARLPYSLEAS